MHCNSAVILEADLNYRGTFKIDSFPKCCGFSYKMPNQPVKLKNAAINTDPLLFQDGSFDHTESRLTLKERNDVKHIHITSSDTLQETYDFGEVLGKGSFGTVVSVTDKQDNKAWAMKVINKTQESMKMKALKREIQILKRVNHPNIIFLHRIFESTKKIYLLLEKCTGDVAKSFRNNGPFSESDTRVVITQLSSAVEYLHKNEIVHRDLKLENILLAENPEDSDDNLFIKVSDFGLGIIRGTCKEMLHDRCGTLTYVSPEVIMKGSYSHLCDVWAMGVIMYLLLEGQFPFFSQNERDLVYRICNEEPNYVNLHASGEAVHLITNMLNKNPALRITAAEVRMHPWLVGKPLTNNSTGNVLEMMKMWRSDMMLPVGSECDWATAKMPDIKDERNTPDRAERPERPSIAKTGRQSLKIPVQNIEFDRKSRSVKQPQQQQQNVPNVTKGANGSLAARKLNGGTRPSRTPLTTTPGARGCADVRKS